jgi:hypothetical protein
LHSTKFLEKSKLVPKIKRKHAYALRNVLSDIETSIPKDDRSPIAQRERDLIATWAVAMWDLDMKRMVSCMSRLASLESPRAEKIRDAWNMFWSNFLHRV